MRYGIGVDGQRQVRQCAVSGREGTGVLRVSWHEGGRYRDLGETS